MIFFEEEFDFLDAFIGEGQDSVVTNDGQHKRERSTTNSKDISGRPSDDGGGGSDRQRPLREPALPNNPDQNGYR